MPLSPLNNPEHRPGLRALWAANLLVCRCYHHLTVRTACTIPRHGPAILTCNHISGIDPMLIQSSCNRPIIWMMASEYYEMKSMRWVYDTIGNIPVARAGRDMAAMRSAMRALKEGRVLGIFPEGRIAPTREFLPFQTGVALMAMRTGVDLYPAYLDGTQRGKEMLDAILHPQKAAITYGTPIRIDKTDPDRTTLEATTRQLLEATERLRAASLTFV